MSDANKLGLGQIIETEQQRDAIHVAIAPVVASERLEPGQHVGLFASGASVAAEPLIGVVDPFLKRSVVKGQRFWLFLYPGTVTGLRHMWTHQAFAQETDAPSDKTANSEKWMRAWAVRHMGEDYYGDGGQLSEQAAYGNAIEAGHRNHIGPYEDARDYIDNEWWAHWENITGKQGDREAYFSCSC